MPAISPQHISKHPKTMGGSTTSRVPYRPQGRAPCVTETGLSKVMISALVGCWTNPFENYARQKGNLPQKFGVKIKHIWNHHPVHYMPSISTTSFFLFSESASLKKDVKIWNSGLVVLIFRKISRKKKLLPRPTKQNKHLLSCSLRRAGYLPVNLAPHSQPRTKLA